GQPMLPLALLQILACAASILLLFRVTAQAFGLAAAVGASLILALYAPDVHYSVAMLRGPWIVLASLLVTDALGQLQARATVGQAFVSGVMVGASLLVNEGFLMLPALVIAA